MDFLYLAIIIIALFIILWLIFGQSKKSKCLSQLNGMWIADEDFCQESGIELMTLYFGDYPKSKSKLCWRKKKVMKKKRIHHRKI